MLSSRLQIGHCPNYKLDPLENSLRATASAAWPTVSAQQEEVHMRVTTQVGETGYGCYTFYITDVFRNIVIIADIRLLLCLNIVSCAHINMQFVIFTS